MSDVNFESVSGKNGQNTIKWIVDAVTKHPDKFLIALMVVTGVFMIMDI
jgi:hypothetical protein